MCFFLVCLVPALYPEGPARHLDASRQKLTPHCLAAIFDSQLPSPKLSLKMPPKLPLPHKTHKRGFFSSSVKSAPEVRVTARQLSGKNCLAAIFASQHQGPLGSISAKIQKNSRRLELSIFKNIPHGRWGRGQGSFAIRDNFSSNFPGTFPEFSWRTPEQTPETATAFSIGCTPRGSCNRTLLRRLLRRLFKGSAS